MLKATGRIGAIARGQINSGKMLKIYIANESKQKLGGGFTFLRNFRKAIAGKVEFVDGAEKCDVYFIASATMVSREEVLNAITAGKKIVLRIDNFPRNSRNRGAGTSRLYDIAQMANLIIYQTQWAKDFVGKFIDPENKKQSEIIINGVDLDIFNPDGEKIEKDGEPQYLYVRYNRDETKRWDEAWFFFQQLLFGKSKVFEKRNPHLWIVGQFSKELMEYNFDFFNGAESRFRYLGVIDDPVEMAKIYRSADILLFPFYNDACSNTYLEASACGCEIDLLKSGYSGGTPELIALAGEELSLERMAEQYLEAFEKL